MSEVTLDTPVQFLKGVGPDRAPLLKKLGIETVEDLLWHLPRDIVDFSRIRQPGELLADQPQTVCGVVHDLDARQLTGSRTLTVALLDCGTDFARGVWFNQPWMIKRLLRGKRVLFSGKPKFKQGRWEFSHPTVQDLDDNELPADGALILTRYPLTEGLAVQELRRMMAHAVAAVAEDVVDPVPDELRIRLTLPALPQALRGVHTPRSVDEYHSSRRRLLFDDLFEFQLGVALRRRQWRSRGEAPRLERTAKIDSRIRRLFPFTFTAGQNQAVREIAGDLNSGIPMHRLLQADVGAGKTVVAIDTMLTAIAHGQQAVLMAPTELLATQHWQTIDDALRESRVTRALLTGSLTHKDRHQTLAGLADGSLNLVVGTQALIQENVRFQRLGVAVIDEQHRFGVAQRAKFSDAGSELQPHVLVMTATPIPRTLCLTQFGDLDVTIVRDQPEGRQPVQTSKITGPAARRKAWEFLIEKLRSGRQLYVVCPLVGTEDEAVDSTAAEKVFRELSQQELHSFRVGLIHGRMKRAERDEVMERFRERELDVLVSTTVIEVGVDVPNATLMVILDAERFGLSQLHQLRGRVARGKYRGYCFLFSETDAAEGLSRLAVLERTGDGFQVAEQDFEMRGPGDVLGLRQHGDLPLRFSTELREEKMLELCRDEAFRVVGEGLIDSPEYHLLRKRVLNRFAKLLELPRSG